MWYAVYGFVFGMLIPYMSRRFSKFMPATMAYAVYRLVKPNQTVSKQKRAENPRYGKLVRRYLMRSVGWGILAAALSYLALHKFGSQYIGWHLAFIWILLLLTEIDNRMQLLPDILTVPLLLLGVAYAAFTGSWVVPAESAWGAGLGYLVPAAASLPFVFQCVVIKRLPRRCRTCRRGHFSSAVRTCGGTGHGRATTRWRSRRQGRWRRPGRRPARGR